MTTGEIRSTNFQFLSKHDPLLLRLASQAEVFCFSEPDLALTRLRQFIETIAIQATQVSGGRIPERPVLLDLINDLRDDGIMSRETADTFHTVRRMGNDATHSAEARQGEALHGLRMARAVAIWFHRLSKPSFKAGAFIPPQPPVDSSEELRDELAKLQKLLAEESQKRAAAENRSLSLEEAKAQAEAETAQKQADLEAAFALAQETEEKLNAETARFLRQKQDEPQPNPAQVKKVKKAAQTANAEFPSELDEHSTREIVDAQLRDAGWEASTNVLRYSKGTRPVRGRNIAIAEWPTDSGPVDYALFADLTLIAVAEAKRFDTDLPPVLGQARRYAEGIQPKSADLPDGSPWLKFRVPFAFAANGRGYLKQLPDMSGIHFHDLRHPNNLPRAIDGWKSPQGLIAALTQNIPAADKKLKKSPVDLPGLRPFQIEAISTVEKRIAEGRRENLLAMATGTGKTRTALSLIYRLVKAKRFRRILFLVDRTSLGEQAFDNGFEQVKLENLKTFTEIYNVKQLGETDIDEETRVHIATVQSMVHRITRAGDDPPPPVDQYDCVIIDECHRGYNLDRDMDDHEIAFRSEEDFISKYTRVIDHFDAVKIGLTATPALHTVDIFGPPVFTYSYREAVTDGYLCDHDPPIRIWTNLVQRGMRWAAGENMKTYNPADGSIETAILPDEVLEQVDSFNTKVITEKFNKAVCDELAGHLDPDIPGKTLVFCATDHHADRFVRLLRGKMKKLYGEQPFELIAKITGSAMKGDKNLIKKFKNEQLPKIVVTVDLLTTGIDVPEITNLVFVRRVKSRILYEQMLGRATRLCKELFPDDTEHPDKETFQIFDTVNLYGALESVSTMKPVVQHPKATIAQMAKFLRKASNSTKEEDKEHVTAFHRELVVKIRRLRKKIERKSDEFEIKFPGLTTETFFEEISASPESALAVLDRVPELEYWLTDLQKKKGPGRRLIISEHDDEVIEVTRGYGEGRERPEDYLERFTTWIEEHKSENDALKLVLTSPGSLNRRDLKALTLALDDANFTSLHLQIAWREARKKDCAASLIGYIRAMAIGSPLIPFEQRVDRAAQSIIATSGFLWTTNQKKWLDRIIKQTKKELILDRSAFETGAFRTNGGFPAIDKAFNGKLDDLLFQLHEQIWKDDVA